MYIEEWFETLSMVSNLVRPLLLGGGEAIFDGFDGQMLRYVIELMGCLIDLMGCLIDLMGRLIDLMECLMDLMGCLIHLMGKLMALTCFEQDSVAM